MGKLWQLMPVLPQKPPQQQEQCEQSALLATDREQPKAASTSKGTLDTKKQQFDRKIQTFAGYFRVNTGRLQPLQMPVISLILYCFPPDFILQMPDFNAHNN